MALIDTLRADHMITILENPITVAIERTTKTRVGRTDDFVVTPLAPITVRIFEESTQDARDVENSAGDVKESARWAVSAPYDAPFTNDVRITDRIDVPDVGRFEVTEVVPVRHDGQIYGWRAVLVGKR